jgi:hypothetical protein
MPAATGTVVNENQSVQDADGTNEIVTVLPDSIVSAVAPNITVVESAASVAVSQSSTDVCSELSSQNVCDNTTTASCLSVNDASVAAANDNGTSDLEQPASTTISNNATDMPAACSSDRHSNRRKVKKLSSDGKLCFRTN